MIERPDSVSDEDSVSVSDLILDLNLDSVSDLNLDLV